MIAVIFEVNLNPYYKKDYLDIAAELRPMLEQVDGFISIERFQSLADQSKILSLSFFRDEQAVETWRNLQSHREAQAAGRENIFLTYRIRVAHVLRDYDHEEREQAPKDSRKAHE